MARRNPKLLKLISSCCHLARGQQTMLLLLLLLLLLLVTQAAQCQQADKSQPEEARSPSSWLAEWDASCASGRSDVEREYLGGLVRRLRPGGEVCEREPGAWRWRYLAEVGAQRLAKSRVLVREQSLDERLANLLYTSSSARVFDNDANKFNSGDKQRDELNMRQVAGPAVDDELCGAQLTLMLELVDQLGSLVASSRRAQAERRAARPALAGLNSSHVQLARVLDSFGRYQSGHFLGRSHLLGSYKQCVGSRLELWSGARKHNVATRYCWARLSMQQQLDQSLSARRTLGPSRQPLLQAGICVPRSCHSTSFAKHARLFQRLVDGQLRLPEQMFVSQSLPLESIFCLVDEDSPAAQLELGGRILLAAAGAWLLLLLVGTLRCTSDPNQSTSDKQQMLDDKRAQAAWLECFDLRHSWRKFVAARSQPNARQLSDMVEQPMINFDMLNPVRMLLCFSIIFCHCFLYTYASDQTEISVVSNFARSILFDAVNFGAVSVDLFLLITAMLASYKITKVMRSAERRRAEQPGEPRASSNQTNSWNSLARMVCVGLRLMLERAIRMLPMLYLLIWFKKTLWVHLSDGPMWDKGLNKDTPIGCCTQDSSWWSPLLMNYDTESVFKKCASIGWYIGADLFTFAIYMPLVLLNISRPRLSKLLSLLIVAATIYMQSRQGAKQTPRELVWELGATQVHGIIYYLNNLSSMYVQPHFRLLFSFIGVFAGYSLYEHEKSASKCLKSSFDWLQSKTLANQNMHNEPNKLQVEFGAKLESSSLWSWRFTMLTRSTCIAAAAAVLAFVTQRSLRSALELDYIQVNYMQLGLIARTLTCLAAAMIFLRLVTDWSKSPLLRWCASPFWQRAVKLSFLLYLYHLDFILLEPLTQLSVYEATNWRMFYLFAATSFFTTILALILHLAVETPIAKIVRKLLV